MEYNQPSEIVKDVSFGDFANKKVVAGVELIDTHGNIQKQSEEIPDISAISPVTKKKK